MRGGEVFSLLGGIYSAALTSAKGYAAALLVGSGLSRPFGNMFLDGRLFLGISR